MATHWCIVMWPSEGRITVQPFVPVYLADNLFEGDANMNEIVASLQCMFLATKKTLSLSPLSSNGFLHSDFMDLGFCV